MKIKIKNFKISKYKFQVGDKIIVTCPTWNNTKGIITDKLENYKDIAAFCEVIVDIMNKTTYQGYTSITEAEIFYDISEALKYAKVKEIYFIKSLIDNNEYLVNGDDIKNIT